MSISRGKCDVVIFGGGIAGLWTLAHLRHAGFACLLIESCAFGHGQTVASQGIIHGGVKYALTGAASAASRAIAEMPEIWRASLEGRNQIDLTAARVLSQHQYLWTTTGIGSRLVGVAASKAIRTPVERAAEVDRPEWFHAAPRGVDVYTVAEPVLDPASVLDALAAQVSPCAILCDPESGTSVEFASFDPGTGMILRRPSEIATRDAAADKRMIVGPVSVRDGFTGRVAGHHPWRNAILLRQEQSAGPPRFVVIEAGRVVLAAGAGNAELIDAAGVRFGERGEPLTMQRRPLHMVMARGTLPAVYGHCVALSDKPRITITSQTDSSGRIVWYIGGAIAEDGVKRSRDEQIAAARAEVARCVPWIDLAKTEWATLRIDRAEGRMADGSRPDEPVIHASDEVLCVWPTKLAFAPLVARRIVERLRADGFNPPTSPARSGLDVLADWPRPLVASLPWNDPEVAWT